MFGRLCGFLGERPSASQVAGVACSLLGIGVIALGRAEGVPLASLGLCICAAASWGSGNVLTRAARTTEPCDSSEQYTAAARPPTPVARAPGSACSRAASSAVRFDVMPPLVKIPWRSG